jgi:hypothetical protein
MRLSQLIIVLGGADTVSRTWVKGIRKGWKDWYNRGNRIKTWENLISHYQEGQTWLNKLQSDLMFNKGMFAVEPDPKKKKRHPMIAKRWKLKIMDHLKAADSMFADAISGAKYQIASVTKESPEFKMDGGRWLGIVMDKWGDLNKWQAVAVPESYKRDAKAMDSEISSKLLRTLSSILSEFGTGASEAKIEWGSLEREFSIGKIKVLMEDIPAKPLNLPPARQKQLRDPNFYRGYRKYIQKAMNLMNQKKLGFLWYGVVRVKPVGTYGENPRGKQFGVGGWYNQGQDAIYIEMDPDEWITKLMVHELGHRYYYKFMSSADRAEFSSLFGDVPAVSEYGGTVSAEDFAEVFAWYVLNRSLTRDQLERFKKYLGRKRGGRRASMKISAMIRRASEDYARRYNEIAQRLEWEEEESLQGSHS